jgi:hypothetical protein
METGFFVGQFSMRIAVLKNAKNRKNSMNLEKCYNATPAPMISSGAAFPSLTDNRQRALPGGCLFW